MEGRGKKTIYAFLLHKGGKRVVGRGKKTTYALFLHKGGKKGGREG